VNSAPGRHENEADNDGKLKEEIDGAVGGDLSADEQLDDKGGQPLRVESDPDSKAIEVAVAGYFAILGVAHRIDLGLVNLWGREKLWSLRIYLGAQDI
jgi:hypothetical protein